MRKKSTKYDTPDAGGWTHVADDLFLAGYRGRPCEICGATHGFDGRKTIRSCGHHLHHKKNCRKFRYEPKNIVILCPAHHSKFSYDMSPHSQVNELAVERFTDWMEENKPEQYAWWKATEQEASSSSSVHPS